MSSVETSADSWRDLVDRLAAHDVRYLTGGSTDEGLPSPYTCPDLAPVVTLLVDLARAPRARLRDSLISLLLRHPEYAPEAEAVARDLPTDRGRRAAIRGAAA